MSWLSKDPNAIGFHVEDDSESPSVNYPTNDGGLNFFFTVLALPFKAAYAPFRFLAGIVSARRVDADLAARSVLDGEEVDPDLMEEVIGEHARRIFYERGR